MDPAVRIVALLVLAASLPALPLPWLLILTAALCGIHFAYGEQARRRLLSGVTRLRWLLFAIVVLYIGYTPGEPVWAALPGLSQEGLSEGTRRAAVLVGLLAAVYWLTWITPASALGAGLVFLCRPLRWLGLDPQRLGTRIALALDAVGRAEEVLRSARSRQKNLADAAAAAVVEIERRAEHDAAAPAPLLAAAPALWQWLLPLALAGVLHLLTRL